MDGDPGTPLEVRLTPWAILAPLLPMSLVLVSPILLLRDSDRVVRAFGVAILVTVGLMILAWSFVIVITLRQQSRIRLDAEGLTLGRWPRIPWTEIREVRVHQLKVPRIRRRPVRIIAFVPTDPAAVYDTIRRTTGWLLRPIRPEWSPYQTPLVVSGARLPMPVDRLLDAVRRRCDAPVGQGMRPQVPAWPFPRRMWGVTLVAALFVVILGAVIGFLVTAPG